MLVKFSLWSDRSVPSSTYNFVNEVHVWHVVTSSALQQMSFSLILLNTAGSFAPYDK